MKSYPIGSISIFINVSQEQFSLYNDDHLSVLKNAVYKYLKSLLNSSKSFDVKIDTDVKWTRGCLICIINLGVSFVLVREALKFLKNYPDYREGFKLLLKDINNGLVLFKGVNDKKDIINSTSQEITILSESSVEYNELYEHKSDIIFDGSKIIIIHRTTIMREDLKEQFTKEELEEIIEDIESSNK